MHTPRQIRATAMTALLFAAGSAPWAAHADPRVQAEWAGLGWRHGDSLADGHNAWGALASATIASAPAPQPESILGDLDRYTPSAPAWGLRGHLQGMGMLSPTLRRGALEGGVDADLGPLTLSARVSYGRTPSFQDRYWRSGRDRLVPGLALGVRGYSWVKGPTDLRAFSFQASVDTPLLLRGDGAFSWDSRASVDVGASVHALSLHRLRDQRHFALGIFLGTLHRYGEGRLLDFGIDVLDFHTRPIGEGWGASAAIGMSALRLTPAPHADGTPSPGQAVPAARIGVGYRGAGTAEFVVGTFHRIDPTGRAIDRGGSGQLLLSFPMGERFSAEASADVAVTRRVRVDAALDPQAPVFHAWLIQRRVSVRLFHPLGAGFHLQAHAFAETSDRDAPLLLPSAPANLRSVVGAGLGLSWNR